MAIVVTHYEVKSHGVTVEFCTRLQDALAAFSFTKSQSWDKFIFKITSNGTKSRMSSEEIVIATASPVVATATESK
jgi:hypothetical protein